MCYRWFYSRHLCYVIKGLKIFPRGGLLWSENPLGRLCRTNTGEGFLSPDAMTAASAPHLFSLDFLHGAYSTAMGIGSSALLSLWAGQPRLVLSQKNFIPFRGLSCFPAGVQVQKGGEAKRALIF